MMWYSKIANPFQRHDMLKKPCFPRSSEIPNDSESSPAFARMLETAIA